jgi:serine/threonine protein kinase
MAPEIHSLLTNPHKPYEIAKTDIFSLGVILFTMVLGRLPFEYATPQDQHYKLLSEGNYEQFWKSHGSHLLRAEHEETAMVKDFKLLFQSMTDI